MNERHDIKVSAGWAMYFTLWCGLWFSESCTQFSWFMRICHFTICIQIGMPIKLKGDCHRCWVDWIKPSVKGSSDCTGSVCHTLLSGFILLQLVMFTRQTVLIMTTYSNSAPLKVWAMSKSSILLIGKLFLLALTYCPMNIKHNQLRYNSLFYSIIILEQFFI